MTKIGILGAGTWGTALARTLTISGNSVTLWSALEKEIEFIKANRTHPNLPEMKVPEEVALTTVLEEAVADMDIVIFAVSSVFTRVTARNAAPFIKSQIVVDVSKGLEAGTHKTLSEVIADELKNPAVRLVALSGPTHAEEVALDMPTTIVAASADKDAAVTVQRAFANEAFRVYTNDDIKGIEISGALKNVIALAAGMSDGLGYGDNAKAAIITRGMTEILRLGLKMGCSRDTFSSLAGIGDLIVTCTSKHSRNNQTGYLIGTGLSPEEAIAKVGMVVEGVNALPAAMELAEAYDIELPICTAVHHIIKGSLSVREALRLLMLRELKPEAEA